MIRLRHKLFIYLLRVFDQAMMAGTLVVVIVLFGHNFANHSVGDMFRKAYSPAEAGGIVLLIVAWLLIFGTFVSYEVHRFTSLKSDLLDLLKATSTSAFLLMIVSAMFAFTSVTNRIVLITWIGTTLLGALSRIIARRFMSVVRRSGYNYRHLLIIGTNTEAQQLATRLEGLPELGYKIVGFISEEPAAANSTVINGLKVIGSLADVQRVLETGPVDEIIICLPMREHVATVFDVVRLAQELGIVLRLFPDDSSARILSRVYVETFDGAPVVTLFRETMLLQLLFKRVLDFIVSFICLVILSPLLLLIATLIKVTSPGPVLFVQRRVGMNKRTFNLYKFRSMYMDAEKRRHELEALNEMDGPVFKIKNDPRITPIGRFIRKTSIDELPQLMNVLRGQMSLVGPRPPLPDEVDKYDWLYRKRLSIKPGITCLWQISGRNHISFKQWMAMDREYIDNWSIWLDLRILAKTVPSVLFGRGAS